jgi:hypothetical protein
MLGSFPANTPNPLLDSFRSIAGKTCEPILSSQRMRAADTGNREDLRWLDIGNRQIWRNAPQKPAK